MDGKGRQHVRVEDSQLPPQNNQSFHVTRYAHVRRPGPRVASTEIMFEPVFTSSNMQLEEGRYAVWWSEP